MNQTIHGLIQKAQLDANALRFHISETDDGWRLSIYEGEGWIYLGKLTRKADIERLLLGYLPQPD